MLDNFIISWKKAVPTKNIFLAVIVLVLVLLLVLVFRSIIVKKNSFNNVLVSQPNELTDNQPKNFPKLSKKHNGFPPLENPTIKEEIGLAMVYPQGTGVGMSSMDSNSFTPTNPGPLLTNYSIPEAYGESSLNDPYGSYGALQGSRIIKIGNLGKQDQFKPYDEAEPLSYSSTKGKGEVQNGLALINNSTNINYNDSFSPEHNLRLQSSPGGQTNIDNCETTYPRVVKYGDFCITAGDIPYGKIIDANGKEMVNPRLVSRWESYTGNYDPNQALEDIDGLLYPRLNVLTK